MKRPPKQSVANKSGMQWFENLLVCVVLGLNVLRLTIVETPHIENLQGGLLLSSENISLLLSTSVLLCALLWLIAAVLTGRLPWRRTWFGPAVGLFIVVGVITTLYASNKRAAVTDLTLLAAPMVGGVMLVQWLRSASLIRLALLLVISVGVAATVYCYFQFSFLNKDTIKNYEENPTEFLIKQGIEPGTLGQWMYEHRLHSNNISGFMMTSNSVASFFLLVTFSLIGLCAVSVTEFFKQSQWKDREQTLVRLICYVLGLGFILSGLFLTRSKGGIGAFILSSLLLAVLLSFRKVIWRRRIFGILLLLLIMAGAGAAIQYGIQQGRLPGGNSMLVRWQYWVSAVDMVCDHALTGVGGGNFPEYYTHYKIPAALETVQNPHNWILSLLSQYGPLGLLAITAGLLAVFFKGLQHICTCDDVLTPPESQPTNRLWLGGFIFSAIMLLIIRPVLVDLEFFYQKPDVAAAAYLFLYMIPALVFVLAFILLRRATETVTSSMVNNRNLLIALMCGLVAVLIHNLVDFAIFEPGNWSLFWLIAAIIIAQIHNTKRPVNGIQILDMSWRLGLGAGLVVGTIAYLAVVLIPPLCAEQSFRRAMADDIHRSQLLENAVSVDKLSPKAAYQTANMLLQVYQNRGVNDESFLDHAVGFVNVAIQRNDADFKSWRLRAKIHVIRSEQTQGEKKEKALQRAFDDLQQAIARYPGSGKLHYLLANVSEQLTRNDIALCHYKSAVDIEDAYRAQFRVMYPERETVISRLGQAAYEDAKTKIEQLTYDLSKESTQ